MKISYLFHEPIPDLTDLAERMQLIAELGYHGIELSATHPLPYPVEEVIALSEKFHLPVVSLLSGWSYSNEGLCLCSPSEEVRHRAVERLSGYVRLASRFGAVLVMGLMQGLRSDEPDENKAKERIAECLDEVARAAVECGSTVVIEPVNHLQVGFNNTAADVTAMVQRIGSPGLGYMLDTIHMNIEEQSVVGAIHTHGHRIRHFHLCETNGGPFGTGNLDFPKVLRALHETGYPHFVSVKVYRKAGWEEAARSSAEFLRSELRAGKRAVAAGS